MSLQEGGRQHIQADLMNALRVIIKSFSTVKEIEAVFALILLECRILYCDSETTDATKEMPEFHEAHR